MKNQNETLENFDRCTQNEKFAIVLDWFERLAVKQGLLLETGSERIDRIRLEGGDKLGGFEVLSEEGWQSLKAEWLDAFKLSAGTPRFRELFVELLSELEA